MIFLSLILCAIILFYFFAKRRNNYWKERGVVTVDSNFIFGISFPYIIGRSSLEEVFENAYKAKPNEPYVGLCNMLQPVLFVRDPALIYQITVKDFSHFSERVLKIPAASGRFKNHIGMIEGDEWKNTRNKLSPAFSSGKIKSMHVLMEECADVLVEKHFRPRAKAGELIDLKDSMIRYSLDVTGKCVFGLQLKTLEESDSLYREIAEILGRHSSFKTQLLSAYPELFSLLRLKLLSDETETFFFDLLHKAREIRSKEVQHRQDLLQQMLDLQNESTDENTKRLFSEENIAANMYAFYNAGHESMAFSNVFALHELAKHPEIQDKLRDELRTARESSRNGVLDYETLNDLAYLEMVVLESLRLHGPSGSNTRLCTKAYQVPNSSLKILPGDQIYYSMAGIHRDEKYFPDPLRFDPDRFSKENMAQMTPHTLTPFGSGPRICLGLRVAKIHMKVCLASVISNFRLSCCDKTEEPIVLNRSGFFHSPKNPVWISVEEN